MECHSKWNLTKMEYHIKWKVTKKGMSFKRKLLVIVLWLSLINFGFCHEKLGKMAFFWMQ